MTHSAARVRAIDSVYKRTVREINAISTTSQERRLIAQGVVRRLTENMDRDYPQGDSDE